MIDIVVLAILCMFAYYGYKKGLIKTLLNLGSQITALLFTYGLNPVVSKWLRQKGLYEILKQNIAKSLGLDEMVAANQSQFINRLDIPSAFKTSLLENNNLQIHRLLNVSGIEDYISGYLANICINIISLIIVFLIINVGLKILIECLNVAAKIPVVKQLNKTGGLICGVFLGVIVIWIAFIFMTFFITNPIFNNLYKAVNNSTLSLMLYKTNILMSMVLKIFA